MPQTTRYYEVQTQSGTESTTHLVDARSQSAAWNHVAKKFVGDVKLATTKRIAELMGKGIVPEVAKDDAE